MSIRSRLLLLVLVSTFLPGILVGIRFVEDRANSIESETGSLISAANAVSESLEKKIQGTAQLHSGLSRVRDLDTPDRVACSRFLSDVLLEYPQYTGILTIDPNGALLCDSLQSGRQLDLRDRGYFKAALVATRRVTLEPAFGRLTGRAVLQIAYPVRAESGELKHILLASLDLRRFVEEEHQRSPKAEILIVDFNGTALVWVPGAERVGREGSSIADTEIFRFSESRYAEGVASVTGPDGNRQVWAVGDPALLHHAGLRVLVGVSESDLIANANARLRGDVTILVIVSLLLFVGVWMVAEFGIRRPIGRFSTAVIKLGSGDMATRIPPPYPKGELGDLITVFNDTAHALERKGAEIAELNSMLRQAQKLEAMGQLTGGIAHDFNNLLTVILGSAEFMAENLSGDRKLLGAAEATINAAERGASLTKRLLAFARLQPLDPKAVDINQHVVGMGDLIRRALGENIEIKIVPAVGLWKAMADPGQIESAVLNLCINARDAMPQGGRLTIETANVHLDAAYAATQREVQPGRYVMIAISDTGGGMDGATLERAFEPFFTTKEVGKGSGLGLSMVYGFVKQSSGHARIYSEPGQGTTVKLYLPRADSDDSAVPGETSKTTADGRGEKILVVEDDDLLRANVCSQLVDLKYRIVAARNVHEALEALAKHGDFELLFTDIVMPGGMNGSQLAELARQIAPGIPVLFTSGYSENALTHNGRVLKGVHLLQKPYRRQELATMIRSALDET